MPRAFYANAVDAFLQQHENTILGELVCNNPFDLGDLQRNAWQEEIRFLQSALGQIGKGYIILEYTIPRIGNRVDAVYIIEGIVILLEFKVGAREYTRAAIEQVTDYALDLKNFHQASHHCLLVPMLIATNATIIPFELRELKPGMLDVVLCNQDSFIAAVRLILDQNIRKPLDAVLWMNAPYAPTPTIIEAAQALYRGHHVADISRNDATAMNLNQTTAAINSIIETSKVKHRKSICFITGVPGAGKTLAGLNIANERHKFDEKEHAIFLSGNQPLVDVLQEALARDEQQRNAVRKSEAHIKARAFIQIIHHFRDDAIVTDVAPIEKVAIFDEAQRAWTQDMLVNFMARKKGKPNFDMSEPEFLISVMDRHEDWAVIICLVGGGQEINTGEAGLREWFDSLRKHYPKWDVYVSDMITDSEYTQGLTMEQLLGGLSYTIVKSLHLAVSLRSFRSEKVAGFVKTVLDVDSAAAAMLYQQLYQDYPVLLTRDLQRAKDWIHLQAKGTERYGMIASSGGRRLRSCGIWVQNKVDAISWFLNGTEDVRSSYFLEETATEFDIQGLELDWTIVCWDANLRFQQDHFEPKQFTGTKWATINQPERIQYLINAYRVLLTRARQGMIIYIPHGNGADSTRLPEFYDGTYQYLKQIGIQEI